MQRRKPRTPRSPRPRSSPEWTVLHLAVVGIMLGAYWKLGTWVVFPIGGVVLFLLGQLRRLAQKPAERVRVAEAEEQARVRVAVEETDESDEEEEEEARDKLRR